MSTPSPPAAGDAGPQPLAPTRTRQRHGSSSKNPNWSSKEDDILRNIKTSCDHPVWAELMHMFPSKTQHQVNERWEKVLNPQLVKGSWTREEDELIVSWVAENGTKSWGALATQLPGRIPKQCRERWHNHLSPSVSKSDWTADEDNILIEKQREWGNKWSKIAELLPGRTDNSVKNRWNSSLKRRIERVQNGMDPVAKRGRKPKRASEPPSVETIAAERATHGPPDSAMPRPPVIDGTEIMFASPGMSLMSPAFAAMWSPAPGSSGTLSSNSWYNVMQSPRPANEQHMNVSDLMGIQGPQYEREREMF